MYAASKQGYVVGNVGTAVAGNFAPVIYPLNTTVPIQMEALPAQQQANGYTNSSAYLINDTTIAAGLSSKYFQNTNLGTRAVRWAIGGSITELEPLGTNAVGFTDSYALSMNQSGTSIGTSPKSTGPSHATMWPGITGGLTALDLNSFLPAGTGWNLVWAFGISDTGFVTGEGPFDPDGVGGTPAYKQAYTMLVPQAGTYGRGDANFDTSVNFDDLLALAANYNTSPAGGPAAFGSDWALAQSLVPEPASLVCLLVGGIALLRRR